MITELTSAELRATKGGIDGYVILSHYEGDPKTAWDCRQ